MRLGLTILTTRPSYKVQHGNIPPQRPDSQILQDCIRRQNYGVYFGTVRVFSWLITCRPYLEKGKTVTGSHYAELISKLRTAMKRRVKSKGVLLHHDNPPAHTSAVAAAAIRECGFELNHLPHSPDLAPSDFHVFRSLKYLLRGQTFESDETHSGHKWLVWTARWKVLCL